MSERELDHYKNGTGILKTHRGSMPWPHYRTGHLQHCLAILQELQNGDFERNMAEDSDSFSSLSILLLAILLSLVPIAVFQDARVIAVVLYAAVTNVLSVLPISIKGIELAVYGSRRHYAFSSNMHGMNSGSLSSVAETFAAGCRMIPSVRQKGIGLLAFACAAMVLGIALEIISRRYVGKFRREDSLSESFF